MKRQSSIPQKKFTLEIRRVEQILRISADGLLDGAALPGFLFCMGDRLSHFIIKVGVYLLAMPVVETIYIADGHVKWLAAKTLIPTAGHNRYKYFDVDYDG